MSLDLRLSIVIPTLNEQANVALAVQRAWGLQPLEVIVADGGSTDETATIASAEGARVVHSSAGRGTQLNAGAIEASGDVLLFLHADTWLEPVAAQQIAAALTSPQTVWGAFYQAIDATGWKYRALERGNAYRARRIGLPYGDQAIFVRRQVFVAAGGFPDQPLMEDVDLSRRLRAQTMPALLDGPLHTSARRWQRQGVIRQTARNWAFLVLWRLGVSPTRLARWYRPHNSGVPSPAPIELPTTARVPVGARRSCDS